MAIATTLKGYLEICRISNLPTIWTNVLCAVILATGSFSFRTYLIPALALSCHYLAGMCLNDICDTEHDALHRPQRPIPSGRVSARGSWVLTCFLFTTGIALLTAWGCREGIYAAVALTGCIVWYDLDHKENPFSVLIMASCRFLVFAVAALAVTGRLPAAVALAAAIHFCYVVCISLVARYENSRPVPFSIPVIPLMLAGISFLDGLILAVAIHPVLSLAGAGGVALMLAAQRYVRGD